MIYKFSVIIEDSGPFPLSRIRDSELEGIKQGISMLIDTAQRIAKFDQSQPLDDPLMFENKLKGHYRGLDFLVERHEEPE